MIMHRAWIRVTAAATTTIAALGGQFAVGQSQYGPYAPAAQYSPQYSPQYSTVAPYGVQPTQPPVYPSTDYRTAAVPSYSPAAPAPSQQRYAPNAPTATQPQFQSPQYQAAQQQAPQAQPPQYQAPQYQAPQYQYPAQAARPQYSQLAKHPKKSMPQGTPTPAAGPQQNENLPAPDSAQGYNMSPYPSTDATNGYFASDPGYHGGYAGYNNGANGYAACGVDACTEDYDGGNTWFGGVYGLYMTRTKPGYRPLTAGIDTPDGGSYFPSASETENELDCSYLVPDWRAGVEIRLGSTFTVGDSCDYGDCDSGSACGCESSCNTCCCQQQYAWEVAWWGIDRDVQDQFVDGPVVGDFRYYGLVNYAGLEYDDGGGAAPVNDFYNYQIPVTSVPAIGPGTVLAQRVRTNFSAQNLELNFMRLPLYTAGCGYDSCAPAFSLTGLCGVRYFRFDDDFEFGTEWATAGQPTFNGWGNGPNELFHDIQMKNQLVGFQLGANMNYSVATRWNVFWDSNFGIYNNHINQYQRMYNPINGPATFTQSGRDATVNSSKDDVAFLGEMRLGAGYLFTEHLRCVLAYRAIGVTGVALAPDQIKPYYANYADTARIDADGSLIIHGIQAGFECNY